MYIYVLIYLCMCMHPQYCTDGEGTTTVGVALFFHQVGSGVHNQVTGLAASFPVPLPLVPSAHSEETGVRCFLKVES